MAYADFQLYSPGRASCNSGWYPTCYQCPSGYIARAGTKAFDCLECASGVVSNGLCVDCESGQYVNSGCQDCPAGQYNGAFTGQTSCKTCVAGKYCSGVKNTANNILCSAGSYGSGTGQTAATCSGACPIGQYCVAGSTSGTNCPASKMAATSSGLSKADQCVDCAAGYEKTIYPQQIRPLFILHCLVFYTLRTVRGRNVTCRSLYSLFFLLSVHSITLIMPPSVSYILNLSL